MELTRIFRRSPKVLIARKLQLAYRLIVQANDAVYEAALLAQEHGLDDARAVLGRKQDEVVAAVRAIKTAEEILVLELDS